MDSFFQYIGIGTEFHHMTCEKSQRLLIMSINTVNRKRPTPTQPSPTKLNQDQTPPTQTPPKLSQPKTLQPNPTNQQIKEIGPPLPLVASFPLATNANANSI